MPVRAIAALIAILLFAAAGPAAGDDGGRQACWNGDLPTCEAGLAANPDDFGWLAVAAWAFDNAGDLERVSVLRPEVSRRLYDIALVHAAVDRYARQEMEAGRYVAAIPAFTFLADYGDEMAFVTHFNQTGGSPYPPDEGVRQAMATVADGVRRDALEGRGLARILSGDADAGIADLRAALELGRLRDTLRVIRDREIPYDSPNPFTIAEMDAQLEQALRDLAAEAAGP